ncbi:hypothetical protein, partial [Thiothrix sp.]|uniref:hypothetical protein n=1 Tax=Thiothrix sp. TaxID=1032 RepID=UPI00257A54F8
MKNILVTLPTEAQLIKIKSMIDFYLGDKINSFLIDYTVNCDDAFGKITESKRKNKYDAFIFDAQGCEYYTGLLNQTNSFRESTRF